MVSFYSTMPSAPKTSTLAQRSESRRGVAVARRAERRMSVLLFDPGGRHRDELVRAVEARGHRIEAHDVVDSAAAAWRSGVLPLVLVAGSGGLELGRKIIHERLARTPQVVAAVDRSEPATAEAYLDAGVDDVLLLPAMDPDVLDVRLRMAEARLDDGEKLPFFERPELFRLLVDTMNEGLGVRNAEGRIIYANEHFCSMLGYSQREITGRRVEEFLDPDSAKAFSEQVKRRPSSRSSSYELSMIHKSGRLIPTIHSGRAIHSKEGTFQGSFAVVTNVTERQQVFKRLVESQHLLEESEERFRDLWDGIPVGAYRLSPDGKISAANLTLVQLLGYSSLQRLLGHDSGELYVDPVDREAWSTLMKNDGQVMDFETEIRRADGTTVWVSSHTRALYSGRRLVGYHGTVEDITARRRAEEALKASEERFRTLVQHTSDMISILGRDGEILYLSPASWAMTGYPAHRRVGQGAFELLHDDDRGRLEERFRELVGKPGAQIQLEYRVAHRDGSWRVVESVMTNQLANPAVNGVVVNTRDVTDRKAAEERLRHDTLHDALTGLPNRVLFMDRLGHGLDRSQRDATHSLALLFLDLDRFKLVNDSLGHAVGDALLVEAGRRLGSCLRPNDTLARLGGDEFGVLLEDVGDPSDPVRVAKRIQAVLEVPFQLQGREVYTTTSIGIALSQGKPRTPEELLRDADTAMYRAKSRGRSGYAIFDDQMHAQILAQLKLETALRRAVDQWQFEVLYQPIVDLDTGRIAGAEALVRWKHPERGVVLPSEFINLAEETGLITTLGNRVMAEACLQMKEWQDRIESAEGWFIGVNLSSRQLAQRDLAEQVERVLLESGLPGSNLVLELTETVVVEQADVAEATLERLKAQGVRFSLDDFGTGPSSLSVLHRFPFDMVKIDHWFVGNVGVDTESDELVEGVMALCRWRRLATVAEGVETEEQRRRLGELGCTYAQGYLFAEPDRAEEVERRFGGS